ncbi:class I SAM-dependent methyltransferase [Dongia sp.]|uniref:class I SAM-dependent methyltransferase n=1 Tax=Dongia sp. TaxID=1977262 RepID=UPI0035B0A5A6
MSRLDSFIRRLEAQRACLATGAELVRDVPGVVLELGLGNGRTFDHLREICPARDIYVFDRQVAAHPDCIPAPERLFLGDFTETLSLALARLGRHAAAFIHVDLGSGDAAASQALARRLTPQIVALMAPGAVIVSDQAIDDPALAPLPLPPDVKPGRYFMAQRRA